MSAAADPLREQAWRLNNLYSIRTKDGKSVPFRLNWAQQELYDRLWANNLILKARQLGMSTLVQLMALDNCLFNGNYTAAVIAHELDAAEDIFERNVRHPYEQAPESLRNAVGARRDSARKLAFSNGSSIRVGTSVRGGTLQFLHVSEFGKICAKYPDKATEIVTGSLQAVGQGNLVVIESTAEGRQGYFYDYVAAAQSQRQQKRPLSTLDYRLFFFPWHKEPTYRLSREDALQTPIPADVTRYFQRLGIDLDRQQRAWWVKKWQHMGMDWAKMKREYPATEAEAFETSNEGSYYARQLAWLRGKGRICKVPMETAVPINTVWDLGMDDYTAVWLVQCVGPSRRLVGYIEGFGEALQHYVNQLWEYRRDGYTFGAHLMPHDARNRHLSAGKSVADVAIELGMPVQIVYTPDLLGGIQQTRDFLMTCWIDEEACAEGIRRLENYTKDWSDKYGWLDRPRHDDNSHGADALRIGAQGQDMLRTGLTFEMHQGPIMPEPEADY